MLLGSERVVISEDEGDQFSAAAELLGFAHSGCKSMSSRSSRKDSGQRLKRRAGLLRVESG